MSTEKKYKWPKSMAVCADKLYELRQKRLAQQKIVDEIEAEEKALKDHIINTLPKSETSGIAGKVARITIVNKDIPQVKDWEAFYKYVKKTNQFELMQKRLADSAINERLEQGIKIPGVEIFKATSISMNKV